ncbi:MAG: membrane-associated phospholipid [Bacteroidetes bacterium]|nr:MAG: membrane-associated phospholipid [Bacteroidota bacterium]
MDHIIQFDRQVFLIINGMHSPFFDFLMFWLSDKFIWIPLYAVLLFLMIRQSPARWWLILISIALLVTITDQVSVKAFKDVFLRLRPCHEPLLEGMVRILNEHCGGKYGFVSSHATNTFGMAVFSGLMLKKRFGWVLPALLVWAGIISYSRIYLGVHYPGDVLAGGAVGALIGWAVFRLYRLADTGVQGKSHRSIH